MQSVESSQQQTDIAQEWISFLKRRNTILSIIWPIFLVIAVLSSLAAFYFSQLGESVSLNLSLETEKNHQLEEQKEALKAELIALNNANSELKTELETLINAREQLSVMNSDSNSKLSITSQMVDNLKQLVAELKSERDELSIKLDDSLVAIEQLQEQHQFNLKQAKDNLTQQLEARTTAYQALANRQQEMRNEMDRLATLAGSKDKQLESLKSDNKKLEAQLAIKNTELNQLQLLVANKEQKLTETENRLNALVAPVGSSGKKSASISAVPLANPGNITGLEEIKKPVTAAPKDDNNQQSFNHNQISILP